FKKRLIQAVKTFALEQARSGTLSTPPQLIGREWQGQITQDLDPPTKSENLARDRLQNWKALSLSLHRNADARGRDSVYSARNGGRIAGEGIERCDGTIALVR